MWRLFCAKSKMHSLYILMSATKKRKKKRLFRMTTAPKGSIPIPWHTWWPAIRGPCLAWHHNIGMTLQHWHDTTCSSGMYRCVKKIKTLNTSQNRAATQPNCIWRMQFKPTMCRRQIIKNNDCVCKNICSKNTHIRTHTHSKCTQTIHSMTSFSRVPTS